jgi:hypothetical protein
MVDVWAAAANRVWTPWVDAGLTLTGQATLPDFGGNLARVADVYDPASGWHVQPGAALGQQFYAPTFLVPGGANGASRVVSMAYEQACWLDVPASGTAGPWRKFPNGTLIDSGTVHMTPLTGVCYRPGHLMVPGGLGRGVVGTTRTLDATDTNSTWVAAGRMAPRVDCNLVLLPTGQVLAVGGVNTLNESDPAALIAGAVKRPQLWTPGANGGGAWSELMALAEQPTVREDHSTAILLPDGRVLSAGDEHVPDRVLANLYCPPYLFRSDGALATRPVIGDAPCCIGWGQSFTVAVSDTDAAHVRNVCLIRPGATTHGFDQNQRFVPLTFTAQSNPPRLAVNAPATPDEAPPGFYLLFVVGSADGDSVPSLARWIRLEGRLNGSGEQGPPGTPTDFVVDAVSRNSVYLTWTAGADDGYEEASGPACEYDLRWSFGRIGNESQWTVAHPVCGEPPPQPTGSGQGHAAAGLSACTWYDFALRARDKALNQSDLDTTRTYTRTLCGGGGGGGGLAAGRAPQATAALGSLQGSSGALIASTERSAGGGWRITVRAVAEAEGLDPAAGEGVFIQAREPAGSWRARSHFTLDADEPALGLSALHEAGRAVLVGDFGLAQVAGAFVFEAVSYTLAWAVESSAGVLDVAALAGGASVTLALGDTLTLDYAPGGPADSAAPGWYLLAGRGLLAGATRARRAAATTAARPLQFALHTNQPNPFAARTTIRFDLPVGAMVRLEVFDVAGRRVALLANHYFPPGYQAVEWDRQTSSGLTAGSGVYFYRLEAGPWRDRRKLVILP